jgi:hypothetical protein
MSHVNVELKNVSETSSVSIADRLREFYGIHSQWVFQVLCRHIY